MTTSQCKVIWIWTISTHILTRRMTSRLIGVVSTVVFQLTSSRGGWLWTEGKLVSETIISTHILTRRMTFHLGKSVQVLEYFNSHPHEEDDVITKQHSFQSSISTHILTRRMTVLTKQQNREYNISTHILTRRMTLPIKALQLSGLFQLTSSRGGWPSNTGRLANDVLFQLTSSRGGWHLRMPVALVAKYFNSHPHEEDD